MKNGLSTMLKVDSRRMFTTRFFYIMLAISLLMPVAVLIMTTMMDGTVNVNPETGEETVVEGFDNVWQVIASPSSAGADTMDMTSMLNINLLYFAVAVLVAVFVSEDFKSGYAKNLFTVRAKKGDYVASKIIICCIAGALMMAAFFVGTMVGGKIAGLPFELVDASVFNVVLCMIAKMALMAVFVPIFLIGSVWAKSKTWLGIVLSCAIGMLLFMMVPMMTPLDASVMNAGMCVAGGALFSLGLGAVSKLILTKRDLE